MLHEVNNRYIVIYRTARERLRDAAVDSRIILTTRLTVALETGLDQRRENLLMGDKVGLVILYMSLCFRTVIADGLLAWHSKQNMMSRNVTSLPSRSIISTTYTLA